MNLLYENFDAQFGFVHKRVNVGMTMFKCQSKWFCKFKKKRALSCSKPGAVRQNFCWKDSVLRLSSLFEELSGLRKPLKTCQMCLYGGEKRENYICMQCMFLLTR